MVPGSFVQVSFQGSPIALLPSVFFSSAVVGVDVTFLVAGDYSFTAIAPDGSLSSALALTVATPTSSGILAAPAVNMVFPPSVDTTFMGTVWIMGDHFLPGATLTGTGPLGPFVAPLTFVNERTLGWYTATPIAGSYTLQVLDPTWQLSQSVTITVGAPQAPVGSFPTPVVTYTDHSVVSPFFGCVRIFGQDFLPGSVVDLESKATGAILTTPLLFVGSSEVWWTLVYPAPGDYVATLRNPDGQATASWSFTVN
jgi:hypothetical protein